jgi:alpha-beta hydrolase superfamily lysophospholipase
MKRNILRTVTVVMVVLLLHIAATPPAVQAQVPPGTLRVTLPFDSVDYLDLAQFKIRVPRNWNGTLLVYLQGTKAGTVPEPVVVPPVVAASQPALEETLLSRGYALAAADFSYGNIDMQAKVAVEDSLALTSYFRGRVGDPTRVILWGTSLGGLVVLKMIEDYPRAFDGAIATCAPAVGLPRGMDRQLDLGLAYAVAFGWPADKWGPLEQLRPTLNFQTDVLANAQVPKADGSNRGAWEFIRLVRGIPSEAFWGMNPVYNSLGWRLNLSIGIWSRAVHEGYAAGPIAQNLDHRYTLKPEEKTYLAGLGVNADELLAKMNARTNIMAAPWARDYMERFSALRGLLRRPTLTLHGTMDNVVDVASQSAYRAQVEWWGCQDRLVQVYSKGAGHCVFTSEQLLTTLEAMESWLNTGTKPDASFFPEGKGFDNKFVPPPWPY